MEKDRAAEIEFTTLRNIIKYCALIRTFDLERTAKELNVTPDFLRSWMGKNRGLVNEVLQEYRKEIAEIENLK